MNFAEFWMGSSGGGPTPPNPPEGTSNSLRFRNNEPAYLANTSLVGATLGSYTCSFWAKRGFESDGAAKYLLTSGSSGTNTDSISYNSDGMSPAFLFRTAGGRAAPGDTGIRQIDQAAWYHVVCVYDQTAQTATIYINGEQQAQGSATGTPSLFNENPVQIGLYADPSYTSTAWQGYLSDFYFVEQVLEPTAFGRYNDDGVWVPREVDFTPAEMRWSDFLTVSNGSFGTPPQNAFNGLLDDGDGRCFTSTGADLTWAPPAATPATFTTTLEIYNTNQPSQQNISWNGNTVNPTGGWVTVYTDPSPDPNNPNVIDVTQPLVIDSIGSQRAELYAVRLDGEIVLDPYLYSSEVTLQGTNAGQGYQPGEGPPQLFDGSTDTQAHSVGTNVVIKWEPSTPIPYNNTVEVYSKGADGTQVGFVYDTDGGEPQTANATQNQWAVIGTGPGEIESVRMSGVNNDAYWSAVRIDGQIYVDGANPSYGASGFHLTFQDPDNIGLDTSGNENNFTANGFGTNPPNNDLLNNFSPTASLPAFNEGQDAMEDPFLFPAMFNGLATVGGSVTPGGEPAMAMSQAGGITATWNGNLSRPIGTTFSILIYRQNTPNDVTITGSNGNTVVYTAPSPADTFSTHDLTSLLDAQDITEVTSISWTRNGDPTGNGFGIGGIEIDGRRVTVDGSGADYDLMQDGPSQNWSTMNPLLPPTTPYYSGNYSNANQIAGGATTAYATSGNTIYIPPTGKWYAEVELINTASYNNSYIGIASANTDVGNNTDGYFWGMSSAGNFYNGSTDFPNGSGDPVNEGDIVGIAFDSDTNMVDLYKNGVINKTGLAYNGIENYKDQLIFLSRPYYNSGQTLGINFGQRPFLYQPEGFEGLQTQNLPAAPIPNGRDHFQVITGPGTGPGGIVGDWTDFLTSPVGGFQPPHPPAFAFDGNPANYTITETNGTWVFAPTTPIPVTSTVEVFQFNTAGTTSWNGTDLTPNGGSVTFNGPGEISAASPLTGTTVGVSQGCFLNKILVDGEELIDNGTRGGDWSKDVYGSASTTYDPDSTAKVWLGPPEASITYGPWRMFDGDLTDKACKTGTGNAQTWIYWRPDPAITDVTQLTIHTSNAQTVRINGGPPTGQTSGGTADTYPIEIANPPSTLTEIAIQGNSISSATVMGITLNNEVLIENSILTQAENTFPSGLWWIKEIDDANQHQFVDSVNTDVYAFASNPRGRRAYQAPAGNSIAWAWDASNPSKTGFSITTGTHGLGTTPDLVINSEGYMWTNALPTTTTDTYVMWDGFSPQGGAYSNNWVITPTTVSSDQPGTYYCWRNVPGFSQIGVYQGNANDNGTFVYCGFKPAFVWMIYSGPSSGDYQYIFDTTRNPYNPANETLRWGNGQQYAEETNFGPIYFLSNGFKLGSSNFPNTGQPWAYAAFAENPLGGSNVSPVTAQ